MEYLRSLHHINPSAFKVPVILLYLSNNSAFFIVSLQLCRCPYYYVHRGRKAENADDSQQTTYLRKGENPPRCKFTRVELTS